MITGFAHVYGDSINTDLIIAGKYTKTLDYRDLAEHCLEDLDATFIHRVKKGDILVVGENFGCGSSREQAPIALKEAGIGVVLAKSYARIFYRNAINIGLPALICDTTKIKAGDQLTVDIGAGTVLVNNEYVISCHKFPPVMQAILSSGGLVPFLKEHGSYTL